MEENKDKKFEILDSSLLLLILKIFFSVKIFIKLGRRVKVVITEVTSPIVIIHPKSITGLIPLNISDRKAQIVVKPVYNMGRNILLVAISVILFFGVFG